MTKALAFLALAIVSLALSLVNYWFVFGLWPEWTAAILIWPLQLVWATVVSMWVKKEIGKDK